MERLLEFHSWLLVFLASIKAVTCTVDSSLPTKRLATLVYAWSLPLTTKLRMIEMTVAATTRR